MAAYWLPYSVETFFASLGRLLENCERHCDSMSYDYSEFTVRRLDEYERTLSILLSRYVESFGHLSSERDCIENMSYLLRRTGYFRALFEQQCYIQYNEEGPEIQTNSALVERNNIPGQPRLTISCDQLQTLHNNCRLPWSDIARTLGVSDRTLRRRRHEFGMEVEGRTFSQISDADLDAFVRQIVNATPAAGLRMVQGSLVYHGYHVQRHRVLHSLRRVDPVTSTLRSARRVIRRTYSVCCPNAFWHIDGNHKLIQPYRIVIHGGIDGFSRMVVYLRASTNNRANTVFSYFHQAVASYNLPSRVRSDLGLENYQVGRFILEARGLNRGSIITGTSVHNQRIERLWRDVNRIVVSRFMNIFLYLERYGVLDTSSELHLYCLHLVYISMINQQLDEFTGQWNNHPVTTENNFSPQQLWVMGMASHQHSQHTAVQDVLDGSDYSGYGIDEEGPVPELEECAVCVPESSINFTQNQLDRVMDVIVATNRADDNGIVSYVMALNMLQTYGF